MGGSNPSKGFLPKRARKGEKEMMVLATFDTTEDYFPVSVFFDSEDDFAEAVKDECVTAVRSILRFCVRGEDYAERKSNLEELAIEYSNADIGDMAMSDFAKVGDFFRTNGKRFGLLRIFKENAIC